MKKLISVLLCVVMLVGTFAVSISAAMQEKNFEINYTITADDWFQLGDANLDKRVNAMDAHSVKAYIVGLDGFENAVSKDAADFTSDGSVTSQDAFYLKAVIAGLMSASDFENGHRVNDFLIGGVDISEFVIVLPGNTTYDDNIYFAYELLLNYVKHATGVTLPVAFGSSASEHCIYFNDVSDIAEGEVLGVDGFRYTVEDGNLYIYGGMRGNMYAVYDILEDYLGYFFYDNSYSLSSKVRCANIEEGTNHQELAGFNYRYVNATAWGSSIARAYFPRHLNGAANSSRTNTSYYGYFCGSIFLNAHSYWYYLPMGSGEMPPEGTLNPDGTVMSLADRYYQKFVNGGGLTSSDATSNQPCATDDTIFETLFEGCLDVIEMCRARGYDIYFENGQMVVSFSINDGQVYCTCKNCRAIAFGGKIRQDAATYEKLLSWYTGETTRSGNYTEFTAENYESLYVALAGRAAERLQEYYPGVSVMTIIYNSKYPNTIVPSSHLKLLYCGAISGCAIHHYGENKCNITGAVKDDPNFHSDMSDEEAIDKWVEVANKCGAEVWYWMYPETYTYYMYDLPDYFDIYYDFQWLYQHGITGVYYEGANQGAGYNTFEALKAKLAADLEWNPMMSLDEYKALIKKYIRAMFGEGYEHVYNYLMELNNAGDLITICVPYFSATFDLYLKSYIAEHYEYMRNELLLAKSMHNNRYGYNTYTNLDQLLQGCEFLGLSACYDSMYTNGTTSSRKTYEERYTWLFNSLKSSNRVICVDPVFSLPTTLSFDSSPAVQFYKTEHRYPGYFCE